MKIRFLTGESFGTRSMATVIEKDGECLFIDPGVALAPWRSGLKPHPMELELRDKHWQLIKKELEKCRYVVITHYHFDHFNLKETEVFRDKVVLLKDPENNINWSQHRRAYILLKNISDIAKKIEISDGREFDLDWVELTFSKPVFHGASSRLGYVTEVFVKNHKGTFLFTSDVQGPIHDDQTEFILRNNPQIVYIDGPMVYLLGNAYDKESLEKSIKNLKKILELDNLEIMVLDHHLTRDLKWREFIEEVFSKASRLGKKIVTAAEFMGQEDNLLEARRKELYQKYPVDKKGK